MVLVHLLNRFLNIADIKINWNFWVYFPYLSQSLYSSDSIPFAILFSTHICQEYYFSSWIVEELNMST